MAPQISELAGPGFRSGIGLGFRVQGSEPGFRVSGCGSSRFLGLGFQVLGVQGFWVFRVSGVGSSGFLGLGLGVSGFGI